MASLKHMLKPFAEKKSSDGIILLEGLYTNKPGPVGTQWPLDVIAEEIWALLHQETLTIYDTTRRT